MEHQNHPEKTEKKAPLGYSKMNHNGMQQGANPPMGMAGHDHLKILINDFK